jgi:signal peptidase I
MRRLPPMVPRRIALTTAVVLVALLGLVAAACAVLSVRVQGESMTPTLHDSDRVLLRPFTGGGLPHRFALVVGRFEAGGPRVVKRVIGLPGDRVQIRRDSAGHVQVEVQSGGDGSWRQVDNPAWAVRDWAEGTACCTEDGRATDTAAPVPVPAGMLFLLGDNAAVSRDSLSLGWARADLVQGVVGWRVWPLGDLGRPGGRVRLVEPNAD